MPRSFEGELNADGLRFAIVASRFNDDIVDGLLRGALDCLTRHGARDEDVAIYRVPGAFEIPTAVRRVIADDGVRQLAAAQAGRSLLRPGSGDEGGSKLPQAERQQAAALHDAVISIGCLIRGDTPHFDFISAQVTNELSRVAVDAQFPVAFGVITCNTYEQAQERSSAGPKNKGWEAALAAIEMANLWRQIRSEGE